MHFLKKRAHGNFTEAGKLWYTEKSYHLREEEKRKNDGTVMGRTLYEGDRSVSL